MATNSSTATTSGDCSETDAGCLEVLPCGARVPDPTADSILEVAIHDPRVTILDDPPDDMIDARVFQADVDVTNQSDASTLIDQYVHGWLASRDSLMVVSKGYPGVYTFDISSIEVPAHESRQPKRPWLGDEPLGHVSIGVDAEYACDGTDLVSGDYVLMVRVMQVDEEREAPPSGVVHSTSTPIYTMIDVTIP